MTTLGRTSNNWMSLRSGRRFWPAEPRVEDIDILDIAAGLAKLCRFAGQTPVFYSVAQHAVICSYMADPEHQLTALLHDAPEAYLVDVPRPVKRLLPGYAALEDGLWAVIARRFTLPRELPAAVKVVDDRMLATEVRDVMGQDPAAWGLPVVPYPTADVHITPWPWRSAERAFLRRFAVLTGATSAVA